MWLRRVGFVSVFFLDAIPFLSAILNFFFLTFIQPHWFFFFFFESAPFFSKKKQEEQANR